MVFNDAIDIKLIELVKNNPVLYDHNDPKYMDFNEREVVWQKIGDELKCPAGECKSRWINIRDINRRILRKRLSDPKKRQRLYKYYNHLSFMQPYYKNIVSQNDNNDWDDHDNRMSDKDNYAGMDSSSEESVEDKPLLKRKSKLSAKKSVSKQNTNKSKGFSKIKKRRIVEKKPTVKSVSADVNVALRAELDPHDSVDAFLLNIGAILKKFSLYHLNLAKSQIFDIVQEHDLQQIVQNQS